MTNGNCDTIQKAKLYAQNELKKSGIENFNIDINAALKYFLKKDDIFIATNKDFALSDDVKEKFINFVNLRKKDMPLAYILGEKEFMSLLFFVNKSTLIPRPDTEILVEEIIERCKDKDDVKILDLCTGSGAIGISLAKYLKNSFVLCVDKFSDTLFVAKKNAEHNKVLERCKFLECDVLNDLNLIGEKFDVVVSNPPYIKSKTVLTLDKTVLDFEPNVALDGGEDGLLFYRKIVEDIDFILKKEGLLAFEIGYDQKEDVKSLLKDSFENIYSKSDLAGNDRAVFATLR